MSSKAYFFASTILLLIALANCQVNAFNSDDAGSGDQEEECHLVSHTISTKDLGLLTGDHEILFPTSVDIGKCVGHCNNGAMHVTSPYHGLMKILSPESILSCCQPVDLVPLIYLGSTNNEVYINQIEELVVDSCGCC